MHICTRGDKKDWRPRGGRQPSAGVHSKSDGSACPLRLHTSCVAWRTSTAGPTARLLTRRARRIGRGDAGIPQPCSPQYGPMRSGIWTVTTSCRGLFGARWSFAMAKEPRSWFRLAEVRPLCRGDPAAFEWCHVLVSLNRLPRSPSTPTRRPIGLELRRSSRRDVSRRLQHRAAAMWRCAAFERTSQAG